MIDKISLGIDARPLSYGMTGNSRYLFEILKYLISRDSKFDFFLYSNKPVHKIFLPFFEQNNIKIKIQKGIGIYWLNYILPKILKSDNIQIFWGTLQLLPYFKLSIPSAVNYHDLNFISAPKTMSKTNFLQHRIFSNKTLVNANTIFCLSQNTLNDIVNYNPSVKNKLILIYPGVTKNENHNDAFVKEKYIFSIGTLEPRKNIKTIIDSYLLLKKDFPNFEYKLVIAGRLGWGEKKLTIQLKNNEFQKDGIIFIENPNEDILSNLYKYCSLFVFPSIHEGFGLPLLEALSEQKVCIASNIPIFKEILDSEIDILVNPNNPIEWKNAILHCIQNQKITRSNLWNESEWTWEKTAKKIETELLKLKKL